jgi:beta-lactamase class D
MNVRYRMSRARSHGFLASVVACALAVLAPSGPAAAQPPPDMFKAHGVEGAFVLLDLSTDTWTIVHRDIAETRFPPMSTFKIPNTMIGLQTGVITGEDFSLEWDGVKRDIPDWNRDHDLASALKYSVVWYYQEVARRIQPRRMKRWLDRIDYGNRETGKVVDRFWLDGPLAISAVEQVTFLRRLHAGDFPFKRQNLSILLRLIELDRGPRWILRGKTGLGRIDKGSVGWLVGSVDRDGRRWIYATILRADSNEKLLPLRRQLTEQLLRMYGALPPA